MPLNRFLLLNLFLLTALAASSQNSASNNQQIIRQIHESSPEPGKRPKLVIGIVVDQMRWDYLYRFSELYGPDGFKRMLNDGFSCENTLIPYMPTITAPGIPALYRQRARDTWDSGETIGMTGDLTALSIVRRIHPLPPWAAALRWQDEPT
jgi:hypothetical protein